MSTLPVSVKAEEIVGVVKGLCEGTGCSCHPFLLSWYHQKVKPPFHFPYHDDTLVLLVVSLPSMFEDLFLPYLRSSDYVHGSLDPLDQCFKHFFSKLKAAFPCDDVEFIQDFEVDPASRRPRVLVQTAGHVAGVAHYYQRADMNPDPWPREKKMYGVCVHPVYGGWFAFRGILIFKDVRSPDLESVEPVDCVPSQAMRQQLLEKFNWSWRDWTFRDIVVGGVKQKYSEQQKLYFGTEPGERLALVDSLISSDSAPS